MYKMMFLILVWTSTALASPNTPHLVTCNMSEGVWEKSDGTTVCIPCPDIDLFFTDTSLKLPQGCITHFPGVYLSINNYKSLKEAELFTTKALNFQNSIQPALENLNSKMKQLINKSEVLASKNQTLIDESINKEKSISALEAKGSMYLFTVITVSVLLVAETTFLILKN